MIRCVLVCRLRDREMGGALGLCTSLLEMDGRMELQAPADFRIVCRGRGLGREAYGKGSLCFLVTQGEWFGQGVVGRTRLG